MAILDAKLPAWQATTKAITPTKAEAKVLEGKLPLDIDGGVLPLETRVLLKDQVKEEQNGLFEVTTNQAFGGGGNFGGTGNFGEGESWVLTRTPDADGPADVTEGMLVPIEDGDTNQETSWIQRTPGPIEVGVTPQTFEALVAGAHGPAGGDLTGLFASPDLAANVVNTEQLVADAVDTAAIAPDAVGTPEIAANAVGSSEIALGAVGSEKLGADAKELFPQLTSSGITKINAGSVELEYPGSSPQTNVAEVSHGLGKTPIAVVVTTDGADLAASHTYGTTKFSVSAHIVEGGAPPKGVKIKARWIAFG